MSRAVLFALLFSFLQIATSFDAVKLIRTTNHQRQLVESVIQSNNSLFNSLIRDRNFFSAEDLFNVFESESAESFLTTDCAEDIKLLLSAKTALDNADFVKQVWAPMLDSAGRIGSAILKGHLYFAGHYSECAQIDFGLEGRERRFRADYFKVGVDVLMRPNSDNESCSQPPDAKHALSWSFGVCLPASCSSAELQNLLLSDTVSANPVCSLERTGDAMDDVGAGFYITLSIMGVVVGICVVAGLVDFFLSDSLKNKPISKSLGWRVFMGWSLYTNVASIFDTTGVNKEGQIGPIHCIRFFSMVWVVLGHLFAGLTSVMANSVDVVAITQDTTTEFIINAFFSVDSFFFIGGVLLTFLWFKSYQKNPRLTNSPAAWVMFYVHRILRLSPPFYMIVLFYSFVLKQLIRYTPLSLNPMAQDDSCKQAWWAEMTYLHNYIERDQQCLGYSWYLATDMQIFFFTPLLIIPLAYKPIFGFIVAGVIFVISSAVNIFLVYFYHWPATLQFIGAHDPEETNTENYMTYMYESPIVRCQVYIVGMLVGWFMQRNKRIRINPIVNVVLWLLTLALMLFIVLGLHSETTGNVMPVFWRAMYSAFSKPAWALCLSWIIVSCYYGYGGPINAFMSWHIWVPLGRLSYCGYLLHLPVIYLVLGQAQDEIYFSTFLDAFIARVIPCVVLIYLASVFWSACFEISFGKVEMLLLGGMRVKPTETVKEANEPSKLDIADQLQDIENLKVRF